MLASPIWNPIENYAKPSRKYLSLKQSRSSFSVVLQSLGTTPTLIALVVGRLARLQQTNKTKSRYACFGKILSVVIELKNLWFCPSAFSVQLYNCCFYLSNENLTLLFENKTPIRKEFETLKNSKIHESNLNVRQPDDSCAPTRGFVFFNQGTRVFNQKIRKS